MADKIFTTQGLAELSPEVWMSAHLPLHPQMHNATCQDVRKKQDSWYLFKMSGIPFSLEAQEVLLEAKLPHR